MRLYGCEVQVEREMLFFMLLPLPSRYAAVRRFVQCHKRFLVICTTVCLALMLLTATAIVQLTHLGSVQAAAKPVPLNGTLTPLLAHSQLVGPTNPQQSIMLTIGLRPQNQTMLTHYAQDIYRASSVNYHRFLTPAQYTALFSPTQQNYNATYQFLQAAGFTNITTYTNRSLLTFRGTVAQAEQTFHVTLSNYSAPDKRVYYANSSAPLLPTWLAGQVQSLLGLNNAVTFSHPPTKPLAMLRPATSQQSMFCPGHSTSGQYLTPDQIAAAYNLNGLYNAHYQGEGQTVALFELDTFVMNDLTAYASCYGHSHTNIQTITVGSEPVSTDGGVTEVEMDAELLLSAAPQLGSLRIYEAANTDAGSVAEFAQIVQDAVPVVSDSWGQCELLVDPQMVAQENQLFTEAAMQGQSIFAASGDSGSAECVPQNSSETYLSVQDPASQPFVTGVGGTTLSLNGSGGYGSETTWNNTPTQTPNPVGGASGGGVSIFWPAPAWQAAPGVNSSVSASATCHTTAPTICREVPDVSLNADPATGYPVYCSSTAASCNSQGGWYVIGGTSAAAPLWAAMNALANEMSLREGDFTLGFLNPALYQIASNATQYAASFHDITTGNNDFTYLNSGKYAATEDYDMATGLGSYNAYGLATNLIALAQQGEQVRSAPAALTWYFAEGSVGGGFQEYITLQNPSSTQDANVMITYLFENKPAINVGHFVARSTRATVNANLDLGIVVNAPQQAIAAIVQVAPGGPPIVAERPMYFNYHGVQSGTDVIGATSPGTSYYFPYADTRQNGRSYATFITMLNPSSSQSATATLTYYTGACGNANQTACLTQTVVIPPLHRGTGTPAAVHLQQQVAVSVRSTLPIVVERPMYFIDTIATAGGLTTGAASVVGATTPGNDWLFAEGYTGGNFQEYLVLANFASSASTAAIKLEYDNGHTQIVSVTVPALGQYVFDVNHANAVPSGVCDSVPCSTTSATSAEVTSTAPIVAERLMYFHYSGSRISGATEAVGEAGPTAHTAYSFAEGYTANSFQEYLTLQNPTGSSETVAVTLFFDTYVTEVQYSIKAHSRFTLLINPLVIPIAATYNNLGTNSYAVSLTVQALGNGATVVAERPMYFNAHGEQGGTDVIGYTA